MEPCPISEGFVGRRSEMQALDTHFANRGGRLAQITGMRGTGKTSLALMYAYQAEKTFPGGFKHIHAFPPQTIEDMVLREFLPSQTGRHLAILDDLGPASEEELQGILTLLHRDPLLSLILVSPLPMDTLKGDVLSLSLAGVNQRDFYKIIKRRLAVAQVNQHEIEKLYAASQGNPLLAAVANHSVRDGLITFQQFQKGFRDFDYFSPLGPDGQPFQDPVIVPEQVVVSISNVNQNLLSRLKANPELLRTLPPRKFEQVVAELLEKQGYSVELTPASRDGGFDMYAAKHDGLGQFLYLVECKRYTPPNKVGVQVVRALHGVVQQKRANAGIIATTSFFTKGAKDIQQELKYQLHLRDYIELQKWLGVI